MTQAPATDPDPARAQRELYRGDAQGGPLHGEALVSRYPHGVLAVDKPNNRTWLYAYQPPGGEGMRAEGSFVVEPAFAPTMDRESRFQIAEGGEYEVVSV